MAMTRQDYLCQAAAALTEAARLSGRDEARLLAGLAALVALLGRNEAERTAEVAAAATADATPAPVGTVRRAPSESCAS